MVICACASDSNCLSSLQASRAHAMVSKTAPAKTYVNSPRTTPARAPHAAPVSSMLHLLGVRNSRGLHVDSCPVLANRRAPKLAGPGGLGSHTGPGNERCARPAREPREEKAGSGTSAAEHSTSPAALLPGAVRPRLALETRTIFEKLATFKCSRARSLHENPNQLRFSKNWGTPLGHPADFWIFQGQSLTKFGHDQPSRNDRDRLVTKNLPNLVTRLGLVTGS